MGYAIGILCILLICYPAILTLLSYVVIVLSIGFLLQVIFDNGKKILDKTIDYLIK